MMWIWAHGVICGVIVGAFATREVCKWLGSPLHAAGMSEWVCIRDPM